MFVPGRRPPLLHPFLLAIGIGEPLFSETETLKALLQGLGLMVSAISGEGQTFLDANEASS